MQSPMVKPTTKVAGIKSHGCMSCLSSCQYSCIYTHIAVFYMSLFMSTSLTKCSKPQCNNQVSDDDDPNIQGIKYRKCRPFWVRDAAYATGKLKWKCDEELSLSE